MATVATRPARAAAALRRGRRHSVLTRMPRRLQPRIRQVAAARRRPPPNVTRPSRPGHRQTKIVWRQERYVASYLAPRPRPHPITAGPCMVIMTGLLRVAVGGFGTRVV